MFQETRIKFPGRIPGLDPDDKIIQFPWSNSILEVGDVLWHYTTQINLRMALNRIHISLYAPTGQLRRL